MPKRPLKLRELLKKLKKYGVIPLDSIFQVGSRSSFSQGLNFYGYFPCLRIVLRALWLPIEHTT